MRTGRSETKNAHHVHESTSQTSLILQFSDLSPSCHLSTRTYRMINLSLDSWRYEFCIYQLMSSRAKISGQRNMLGKKAIHEYSESENKCWMWSYQTGIHRMPEWYRPAIHPFSVPNMISRTAFEHKEIEPLDFY